MCNSKVRYLKWNVAAVDNDGFEEELENESNIPESEPHEKSEENEGDVDLGKEIDKFQKKYIFSNNLSIFVGIKHGYKVSKKNQNPKTLNCSNFSIAPHG